MATIEKRVSSKGAVSYRAKIRLLDHEPVSATFTRKTDAQAWVQETETAMRNGRYFTVAESKKHTLAEAIDKYISSVLLKDKPKDAVKTQALLTWWKDQIGNRKLDAVNSALLTSMKDKLLSEPIVFTRNEKQPDGTIKQVVTTRERSSSTVIRYLAALGPVFVCCVKDWKWLDSSPMRKIRKPKETEGRVRFLSGSERTALLTACRESSNAMLYPIVLIALSTGMRYGEIMKLSWKDVDFEKRRMILHHTKNGQTRAVPLVGPALDEMVKLSKVRRIDGKLIFGIRTYKGERAISIRGAWESAVAKAGIENFRFHDLRHSAASELAMSGASLAEIAEVLGHKTLVMVKRYAHLCEGHTHSVVERMNQKVFGG